METADYEFTKINRELSTYKRKVKNEISKPNQHLLLDKDSLSAFKLSNEILKETHDLITSNYGIKFVRSERYKELIDRFKVLDINSINQLEKQLNANKEHFIRFVELFMQERNQHNIKLIDTSPLFYFAHFMAASKGDDFFQKYRQFKNNEGYRIISQLGFPELYKQTEHEST